MDFSKLDLINKLLSDAQEHMAEQYDEENIRLNDIIINLSGMVKEKEEKIQEGKDTYKNLKEQAQIVKAHETTYKIDIDSIPDEFKSD